MKKTLIDNLIDLVIALPRGFEVLHPRTRNYDSFEELKCTRSGVLVLEEALRNIEYYLKVEKSHFHLTNPLEILTNFRKFLIND